MAEGKREVEAKNRFVRFRFHPEEWKLTAEFADGPNESSPFDGGSAMEVGKHDFPESAVRELFLVGCRKFFGDGTARVAEFQGSRIERCREARRIIREKFEFARTGRMSTRETAEERVIRERRELVEAIASAMAALRSMDIEKARTIAAGLTDAERAAISVDPTVAAEMARQRAARIRPGDAAGALAAFGE